MISNSFSPASARTAEESAPFRGAIVRIAGGDLVIRITTLDVPYKTPSAALLAVVSGEVQFMVADLSAALPQIKTGEVKGLAI